MPLPIIRTLVKLIASEDYRTWRSSKHVSAGSAEYPLRRTCRAGDILNFLLAYMVTLDTYVHLRLVWNEGPRNKGGCWEPAHLQVPQPVRARPELRRVCRGRVSSANLCVLPGATGSPAAADAGAAAGVLPAAEELTTCQFTQL